MERRGGRASLPDGDSSKLSLGCIFNISPPPPCPCPRAARPSKGRSDQRFTSENRMPPGKYHSLLERKATVPAEEGSLKDSSTMRLVSPVIALGLLLSL